MDEEKTKLHFTRVRSKGDSTYFDPQTDIRVIWPTAVKMTTDLLMQVSMDDWVKKSYSYLAKCFAIYQIRLAEDSTDMVTQVNEYEHAIAKVPAGIRARWQNVLFTMLNAVYGLFTRRDEKTDGPAIRGLINTAKQATMLAAVEPEQAKQILDGYKKQGEYWDELPSINENGVAVCEETDEVVQNIKQMAKIFIDHSGPEDWNSLSKACDAFFMSDESDKLDDRAKMAVSLAYPSYDLPYLVTEVDQ